jgi:7-dehydrocholesterol reductase
MQQIPPSQWGGGISGDQVERVGPRWLRSTVVPLILILVCPPAAMLLWYTHVKLGGSLAALLQLIGRDGLFATVRAVWGPVALGSKTAWTLIAVFAGLQLLLLRVVPGRVQPGPVTPSGHVPQYRDNGLLSYLITVGLFLLGARLDLYRASILYDHFGEILGALNVFSLLFCLLLYVKGRLSPSTADHGTSGNPIFDYYWGTELYPKIFGFDVKRFTNCRFGMMAWPLILLSFAAKQRDVYGLSDSMIVAVGIQFVYLTKFYIWEMGYLRSLDIMHDRAGFYICWGCLVWVPSVYTSVTLYLVNHPKDLGLPLAALLFVLGSAAVIINYLADAQRQRVRATGGQTTVWGRPPEVILGHYTTKEGEQRVSLLLCSGYWGLARHFHYVPEWLGALFWSLPAGFSHLLPYFYVIFLGVLLTDRAFRDDNRCAAKYGDDWESYRRRVPYRIIPGLL